MPRAPPRYPGVSRKLVGPPRARWAVVSVRPSPLQQLERHHESTRLPYGLVDHALACGWAQQRGLVSDEDWGKAGTAAAGRPGLQRFVAAVSRAHVGSV